ncbi:MAG TPA: DUF488 family protein [Gemmatimonadales bacterium]|nr:DUF488 family protein [Gemmatimonadales bacterium]
MAGRDRIRVKRAYQAPARSDGVRILVDRLWPRGLTRARLKLDLWQKDVAPSTALRVWFHKDTGKWAEFRKRYRAELDARPESWRPLLAAARRGVVTLLFGSRDVKRNHALLLKAYLARRL